jgi:hypothetical protein
MTRTGCQQATRGETRLRRAPLTFSQLAFWQLHQLSTRGGCRNVAAAMRLRGRVNVQALHRSIVEIVRRHDALRTRIVIDNGIPMQEVSSSCNFDFRAADLTALAESRHETEVRRRIESVILDPVDVSQDSLFAAQIVRLRDDEHVLVVALDHIISDMYSLDILLREVFTAYRDASASRAFSLPAVPIQFADYAVWQRSAQNRWLERHGNYWNDHLRECPRVSFPGAGKLSKGTLSGWVSVPLRIGRDLTTRLRAWCRESRTSVAMSVFTAYAALVLRWCGVSEGVVRYQGHGRAGAKTERAIGFFASRLYLRIRVLEEDRFINLIQRVTEEYCNAYEHDDYSYLETRVPPPESARNTFFNWIPAPATDLGGSCDSDSGLSVHSIPFVNPWFDKLEWDNEPMILLAESADGIAGGVYFPLNRLTVESMECFVRTFLTFVTKLLLEPERRIKDITLL